MPLESGSPTNTRWVSHGAQTQVQSGRKGSSGCADLDDWRMPSIADSRLRSDVFLATLSSLASSSECHAVGSRCNIHPLYACISFIILLSLAVFLPTTAIPGMSCGLSQVVLPTMTATDVCSEGRLRRAFKVQLNNMAQFEKVSLS